MKWALLTLIGLIIVGTGYYFYSLQYGSNINNVERVGGNVEQRTEEIITEEQQMTNAAEEPQTLDKEENVSEEQTMKDSSKINEEKVNAEGSMVSPATPDTEARATVMIAGGCFWCVEADAEKLQGVLEAVSGYAGGSTESPTYEDYSKGGHREVALITYNPSVVSFREIVIYMLKHMDPTDPNGSFYDRGVQYAPAFYYQTESEKRMIEEVIERVDELEVYDKPIAALVLEEPKFWPAEDFHQDYYKGTLSSLKYKFYRSGSGRDDFIEKHWGDDTGPTLPGETNPYDVSAWEVFQKPSEEELRSTLTAMQYKVTQQDGTEPAFNNEYFNNKEEGLYVDVVSGEPLFSSTDKFDSGTGWPSFTRPLYPEAVTEHDDFKLIVKRTEIRSKFADSHLGHVFNDAPPELGGIRYCMNSASLRFVPKDMLAEEGYAEFLGLFE